MPFQSRFYVGRAGYWGPCHQVAARDVKVVKELGRKVYQLNDVAGGVHLAVGESQCGDDAIAAAFRGAEIDEQYLVLLGVDDFGKMPFQCHFFTGGQVAFKDGILEVISKILARFENVAQPFVIGDIVGDDVGVSHGELRVSTFRVRRHAG